MASVSVPSSVVEGEANGPVKELRDLPCLAVHVRPATAVEEHTPCSQKSRALLQGVIEITRSPALSYAKNATCPGPM